MGRPTLTVALLDGDVIAFRASAAAQADIDWDNDGDKTPTANAEEASAAAIRTVRAWADLARCDEIIVTLTGRLNFRKTVLDTYKHNRAGKVKPLVYAETVRGLCSFYKTQLVEGLEADDIMGIMATRPKYEGAVVVTIDKDLRGVPGRHLNPLKDDKPVEVSLFAADHYWLTQTLTGDSTDGYVGIPKIGAKKAAVILGGTPLPAAASWPKVVEAAIKAGFSRDYILQQARVARILRDGEYDKDSRSVKLWTPPGDKEQWLKLENCK